MPQMVLDGVHVRFCQHCGRFQLLQEFDGAFKSCRKSLERHRNSQSRRIRTKTSTKASSESDDFKPCGARKQRKKFEGRAGGPNSSLDNTEDSNKNEGFESPYDGSTPNDSGMQMQSIDGSLRGSELERQQCGGSSYRLVPTSGFPPTDAETCSFGLNGNLNSSARTTEDAPSHTENAIHTRSVGNVHGGGIGTHLPIPCTNVALGTSIEQVSQIELLSTDDLYKDGIINDPTDWIPDLLETAADGILDAPHDQPRLAPLPLATDATLKEGAGHARAVASLLANAHHHHHLYSQREPGTSESGLKVSNCSHDAALNLVTFEYPNTLDNTHDGSTVVRASLKLFNTQPEHLPPTVREALMEVMATSDTFLTANARPGCVYITANVVLKKNEADAVGESGAKGLLINALAQGTSLIPAECMEGPRAAFLAQLNVKIAALGTNGRIASVFLDSTSDATSEICAVVPLAMTSTDPQYVTLLGRSISGNLDMVVCRRGEDTPNLGVLSSGPSERLLQRTSGNTATTTAATTAGTAININTADDDNGASENGSRSPVTMRFGNTTPMYPPGCFTEKGLAAGEYVQISLMELKEGLHDIEIQKGSMLSPSSQSLLVIDDPAVVAEVRQLEIDSTGVSDIPAFIQAIGIVVEHLKLRREGRHHPNGSIGVAQRIAPLAAAIVTVAISRKWPSLLRVVCPAASPSDVEAQFTALLSTTATTDNVHTTNEANVSNNIEGFALLHMVAASGCVELVEAMEEWGHAAGHMWLCNPIGAAQITPLHIAAILDDNAAMASALTKLFGTACHRSWYHAKATDGVTPAQAAKIAGNEPVLEFLREHLLPKESFVSLLYDNEDGACSSLCTSASGGLGENSTGFYSPQNKGGKSSSESFENVPLCPDEWPYSTFYGTNGLLQRSAAENTRVWPGGADTSSSPETAAAAARGGETTTTHIDPRSSADAINLASLSVRGATGTAGGIALSVVAGIGALAVRLYCSVHSEP
jgi:hypothetical protein